jgi:hypothetical protein
VAAGKVFFVDQRRGVDEQEDILYLAPPPERAGVLAWERAEAPDVALSDLRDAPEPGACFDDLPETLNESSEFGALKKDLADWLYRNKAVSLLYCPPAQAYSRPGEAERDFSFMVAFNRQRGRRRDREIAEVNDRTASAWPTLEDRVAVRRRSGQRAQPRRPTPARRCLHRRIHPGHVPGAALHARCLPGPQQTAPVFSGAARGRAGRREPPELREEVTALEAELANEVQAIRQRWEEALTGGFEEFQVTPRRADVKSRLLALGLGALLGNHLPERPGKRD